MVYDVQVADGAELVATQTDRSGPGGEPRVEQILGVSEGYSHALLCFRERR